MTSMGDGSSGLRCDTRSRFCSGAFNQLGYGIAQLRTLILPESNAIQLNARTLWAFRCNWVVKTNTLNKATITAVA